MSQKGINKSSLFWKGGENYSQIHLKAKDHYQRSIYCHLLVSGKEVLDLLYGFLAYNCTLKILVTTAG